MTIDELRPYVRALSSVFHRSNEAEPTRAYIVLENLLLEAESKRLTLLDAAPVVSICQAATVRPNGATTGPYPRCKLAFGHPGVHFFQMSDAAPVGEKETP